MTSRRCPLLATFLFVFFCLLSLLISNSRFDSVWFRLSCDHSWIRSGSVNVRKTTTTTTTTTAQDTAHKGFCWTFPLYRPSRSLKQLRAKGFLRIRSTAAVLYKGMPVRALNLHWDQKSFATTGGRWEISLSHRIIRIEGSAEHSPCTCVDRPSRSHHE